jgi:hypothetical protein
MKILKILVWLFIVTGLLLIVFFILKINPKPKIIVLERRAVSEQELDKMAHEAVGKMTIEE